mmetsp:Transcript_1274/g.2969  ORF Transcript_1274/g.2969 Transcript_1274/m.2969 type:complete len:355 (-) Transcript_1274:1086-2150(-)
MATSGPSTSARTRSGSLGPCSTWHTSVLSTRVTSLAVRDTTHTTLPPAGSSWPRGGYTMSPRSSPLHSNTTAASLWFVTRTSRSYCLPRSREPAKSTRLLSSVTSRAAPTPATWKSCTHTGADIARPARGSRGGNAVSTTSLMPRSYAPTAAGRKNTLNFASEDAARMPRAGSMAKMPSSHVWSHSNGSGTCVEFLMVNWRSSSAPGTTGPNHTGRSASSPASTARPSSSLTLTSRMAPLPTMVNVFTWQLSHTMRNCCRKSPPMGGAKPTRRWSTPMGFRSISPGPTRNGARSMQGTCLLELSSPSATATCGGGSTSGVTRWGQSESATRRKRPLPPMFLNGTRVSTSLPTST